MENEICVVTGAFGFTGSHIAARLLAAGKSIRTLTSHVNRLQGAGPIRTFGYNFDKPDELVQCLRGAGTLYNTYWVRMEHGSTTFDDAVTNSIKLIWAAGEAGVARIVHISASNASPDAPEPYYRGKAAVEQALERSHIPHAIIRPTIVFGLGDILFNNIAWNLRHFPIFPVFGDGQYKIQPVAVQDVADLAVEAGSQQFNMTMDAAGPEIFTFNELLESIKQAIGSKTKLVHVPPAVAMTMSKAIGLALRDVVLTSDEARSLMANMLISHQTPTGKIPFTQWLTENRNTIGASYSSELKRHWAA
jgi:NADH dehydrogenase